MNITPSVVVGRPVTDVFDAMADARNEPKWNSQVSESTLESGEPIGRGSTFRTVNRGQAYTATITEYERPDRLTFEVAGKQMTILSRIAFAADGDGTRVDATFDMQPHGAMKVFLPLLGPAIRRDFPKQFASFKAFCEGH